MPLTCYCDEFDPEYHKWWYIGPIDYSTYDKHRSTKCSSCGGRVHKGDTVAKFRRFRPPRDIVEEKIYGEEGEIPLADYYLCEQCADLYFSLEELGYECVSPSEDMREPVGEYSELVREAKEEGWI